MATATKVTEEEYLDSRRQQLGVGLDEIDYVVLSHLHFDHAGKAKMFEGTNAGARLPRA